MVTWLGQDMTGANLGSHSNIFHLARVKYFLFSDHGRPHQLRDLPAGGQQTDVLGECGRVGQVLGDRVRRLHQTIQGTQGISHQHEVPDWNMLVFIITRMICISFICNI